jgi:stearoyl-CoA desaturase (delta-9 desaturase)
MKAGGFRRNAAATLTDAPAPPLHTQVMDVAVATAAQIDRPRWFQNLPFWGVHVAAVAGAIAVGWSWSALWWLIGGYAVRMFGITAGFHRYFAHRTFKTSRWFQFVLALMGLSAAQQGPLWWAAHHRNHHKYSDEPEDVHSPRQRGFVWSHMQWFLASRHKQTHHDRIKDFGKYPELRVFERWDLAFVIALGLVMHFGFGAVALFWGFFVPIVLAWHVTFCINSLAHVWGKRRYPTSDDSRNNALLGLLAFGEGWHNNHHHYQRSARQGFFWWEIDLTYYVLKLLEVMHLVWDVDGVPRHVRDQVDQPTRERVEALRSAA